MSAPANDLYANAQLLTGESGTVTGDNTEATLQAGESAAYVNGYRTVWYKWTAPRDMVIAFDTFGSSFDTILEAWSGAAMGQDKVADNDDAPSGGPQSKIQFSAHAGTTYHIAVESLYANDAPDWRGPYVLNWYEGEALNQVSFDALPTEGGAPLYVEFTDYSGPVPGSPEEPINATQWAWDFGDGGTSTQQNPAHTYETPGTYNVILRSNPGGSMITSSPTVITVYAPPVLDFTPTSASGPAAFTVQFENTTSGDRTGLTWSWNFGDGGTSADESPAHTYVVSGTYTVTLTAFLFDDYYDAVQYVSAIEVTDPPEPVEPTKGPLDIPVTMLTPDQYADITVKKMESAFPVAYYDDGDYPLRTISVWPVPNKHCFTTLWLWQPLINTTDLDAEITFPPGYERALKFNLAVEIAAEMGKVVPGQVKLIATESLGKIKRINAAPRTMELSDSLRSPRPFNWITGDAINWRRRR